MDHRIVFVFRKTDVFFSIENIFTNIIGDIRARKGWVTERAVVPRMGLNFGSLFANRRFARGLRADVYHVTGDVHYMTLFLPGARTVLTVHDCVFMYSTKGFKRWALQQLMLKWPVRRCRWVTCVSEQTKRDILRFSGCAEEKVRVIPNPVDRMFERQGKKIGKGKPVLLFIGTTINKNLERTAEALKGIPCVLDIIGRLEQPARDKLESCGIEYRQSSGLSNEEMVARYAGADIVLFPSLFEGFGMPILEGQRAGRPVITSNLSPMKEVAGAGACLVDPHEVASIRDAVRRVLGEEDYRDQLVARGFENSRRFGLATITDMYEELYKDVLDNGGRVKSGTGA